MSEQEDFATEMLSVLFHPELPDLRRIANALEMIAFTLSMSEYYRLYERATDAEMKAKMINLVNEEVAKLLRKIFTHNQSEAPNAGE